MVSLERATKVTMDSWRRCGGSCGTCATDLDNIQLKRIRPDKMLEWAHSVIDVAEDLVYDKAGIPMRYRFKCDSIAVAVNPIISRNMETYLNSSDYHRDTLSGAIAAIHTCLSVYNENRNDMNINTNSNFNTLSQEDINSFKFHMDGQVWFSVVHAAIDEINITPP